jgi:lipoyl(octanoyl) transferase
MNDVVRNNRIEVEDLGKMAYRDAWNYQEELLQKNLTIKSEQRQMQQNGISVELPITENHLLFVEHPPVYTLGKSGDISHVLIDEQERKEKGIEYVETNRGGDITYHGPGQIVGYPILDLEHFGTDIAKYLRRLEDVIILTLADYGIKGERSVGETGVWLDPDLKGKERKICAMGVRCSRWVTMHGFALNVNTDLSYFQHIVPCGIANKQVASMHQELLGPVDITEVKGRIITHFETVFEAKMVTEPFGYSF